MKKMSIVITKCKHSITEVEGENVCKDCGLVTGYSEIESFADWQSHNIKLTGKTDMYPIISQITKNLNLPSYALQTILQIATKLNKMQITKKQSILYAVVYACRIHNIPRLLGDVFYEIEKAYGKRVRRSEKTLLRLLSQLSKKIENPSLAILSPNKEYYLQAYLAKIQKIILKEADEQYFDIIRARSFMQLKFSKKDASVAAKDAILLSTSRIMRSKIMEELA